MDTGTDLNSASYSSDNWEIVAEAIDAQTTAATTFSSSSAGSKVYRGLEIFGAVIEGPSLDNLRNELLKSQVLVNRDGYQVKYFDRNGWNNSQRAEFVIGSSRMVKLNNVFGWGKYGVEPAAITTVWNRYHVAGRVVVVDYVAAEERRREMAAELEKQRREIREWKLNSAEKEEVLEHYKRILEETKELMWEEESGKERLEGMMVEKNRVVEEQSRVLEEKEMEIQRLKLMMVKLNKHEKMEEGKAEDGVGVVGDGHDQLKKEAEVVDDFKAVLDSFLRCYNKKGAAVVFL